MGCSPFLTESLNRDNRGGGGVPTKEIDIYIYAGKADICD